MKQKISYFLKNMGNVKYPLFVIGAVLASVCIAATIFAADVTTVEVDYQGQKLEITSHNGTVKEALYGAGVVLSENETLNCSSCALLSDVETITIGTKDDMVLSVQGENYSFPEKSKVDYSIDVTDRSGLGTVDRSGKSEKGESVSYETEMWDIDYETEYQSDSSMYEGDSRVIKEGVKGKRQVKYTVRKFNGKVVSKEITENKIVKDPVTRIVARGTKKKSTTEKGKSIAFTKKLADFRSTAYSAQESGNIWGYSTASGLRAQPGIIAVDTSVIPLGTKVYVETEGGNDYGYAIAADTGNAIKGNIIDVYIESVSQCYAWGRKTVNIYILEDQSVNIFSLR